MLHDLTHGGGYVALIRAAGDREGWRQRERMSKAAVQQKTTDVDGGDHMKAYTAQKLWKKFPSTRFN